MKTEQEVKGEKKQRERKWMKKGLSPMMVAKRLSSNDNKEKDKHLFAERFWERALLKYNLSLTEFVYLPNLTLLESKYFWIVI